MRLRLLLGKIGRLVFFFGADGGVGANIEKRGNGALVFAVGKLPQDALDGVLVVANGKCAGGNAARATLAMSVIEVGRADAHGDVGEAPVHVVAAKQAAEIGRASCRERVWVSA